MKTQINWLHILVTGPLMIYIGLARPSYKWIYALILATGVILTGWFLYRIIKTYGKRIWLIIHFLLFVPLLIYVGIKGPKTHPQVFQFILAIGVLSIVYHALRLFQKIDLFV